MHIVLVTETLDGGMGGPDDVWQDANTLSHIRLLCDKYCHERQAPNCWDQDLPCLALGHRCPPQASTRLFPHHLLYGVDPVVPPRVRARWERPLDLSMPDRDALWAPREQRCRSRRADMLSARGNLATAQHCDPAPTPRGLPAGDYAYVLQCNRLNTLQLPNPEQVPRVVSVTTEGVTTLVGRCGGQRKEHVANLASGHLPNLDPQADPRTAIPEADLACERCGFPDQEDRVLLYFRQPPLTAVPKGTWVCPTCLEADDPSVEMAARALRPRAPAGGAKLLDGCLMQRHYQDPLTLVWRVQQGTAYHQASAHPSAEFEVQHDGGCGAPLSYRQLKSCMLGGPVPAAKLRGTLITAPRAMIPDSWLLDTGTEL
ncbi:hypothetical protein TSOC_010405 [Tetrabaena socialis]|uniref:Uncharacterized protein n=1 Tax=Tetrabaena socialis TaxID=47790 RepID=A0A2J7ZTD3_9CHLO|nr:hypothetical protein TSOC_010405 [Tetrabaena socialis]|eukprot:PNH03529.1 hypothetical protein TSOC_010405 [Tetrabaena socialis]